MNRYFWAFYLTMNTGLRRANLRRMGAKRTTTIVPVLTERDSGESRLKADDWSCIQSLLMQILVKGSTKGRDATIRRVRFPHQKSMEQQPGSLKLVEKPDRPAKTTASSTQMRFLVAIRNNSGTRFCTIERRSLRRSKSWMSRME